MKATRTALIVTGSIAAMLAAALLAGAFWINRIDVDSGYLVGDAHRVSTQTHAFATYDLDVLGDFDWFVERGPKLRVAVEGDQPLFVGIADSEDVEGYLAGIAHERVTAIDIEDFALTTQTRQGAAERGVPADEAFWQASVQGTGTQTLELEHGYGRGQLSLVVMNADASQGVDAELELGAHVPWLPWVGLGGLIGGGLLLAGAAALLYLGVRPLPRRVEAQGASVA